MANDATARGTAHGSEADSQERRVNAWVGKALRIEGHIVSDDNLTIDGNVEGTIVVGDHTLTVGPGATVKADLTARTSAVAQLHVDAWIEPSHVQAARVAEFTGFFLLGKMIEFGKTEKIFTKPSDKRTEDYITGRFG